MAPDPTPVAERTQRVHRFSGRVLEALDDLTGDDLPLGCLSPSEATQTVSELLEAAERLQGLALTVLPQAERLDAADFVDPVATDVTAWLAHARTLHGKAAHRLVKLSQELEQDCPSTGDALRAGRIDVAQAEVVAHAVTSLPHWVETERRAEAERHLLRHAEDLDAVRLRRVARHLLEVVDPDGAERELARRLQTEEDAARAATWLRMWDDGRGTTHGDFRLPTLYGAMLGAALQALTSPQRPGAIPRQTAASDAADNSADAAAGSTGEATPVRTRLGGAILGDAFCELIEHLRPDSLPQHGGRAATVVVTMSLETLLGGLAPAALLGGEAISAGAARKLACQAGVIPAVLGSESQVLDLGRHVRPFSPAQRLALSVEQGGECAAVGCRRPAAWSDAHHLDWWAHGGPTDKDNGALLCSRHHTLIHHPAYEWERLPDRQIRIRRRSLLRSRRC